MDKSGKYAIVLVLVYFSILILLIVDENAFIDAQNENKIPDKIIITFNPGAKNPESLFPITAYDENDNELPDPFNLTITTGGNITWVNNDNSVYSHSLFSGSPDKGPTNLFYIESFNEGNFFSFIAEKPRSFSWYDKEFPHINGTINVVPPEQDQPKVKTDVKFNQTLPTFFGKLSDDLSKENLNVIEGLPVTVSLIYKDGELDSANNVIYKVQFKIPNQNFKIIKYDKGTFENVSQIEKDTFIFKTNKILKNVEKTGLVVFDFNNNTNIDRKLTVFADITIDGKTQKTIIDPAFSSLLNIGTKIIELSRDTFELGQDFYNAYVPCVNMNSPKSISGSPHITPQWKIEIINCSNHPQLTRFSTSELPTFVNATFTPRMTDVASQDMINSNLTLIINPDNISESRQIIFEVFGDVVYNLFGNFVKVASASSDLHYIIKSPMEDNMNIYVENLFKNLKKCTKDQFPKSNINIPKLIQFVESIDSEFSNSINNLIKLCINGYENIEKTQPPISIVFSIDNSKSMKQNDKDNLRFKAVKSFIDKLDPSIDKAGFVGWAENIESTIGLTSDFSTIKNEIEPVKLGSGTNLDAGLEGSIRLLDGNNSLFNSNSDSSNITKVILFLSDGEGVYTSSENQDSIINVASSKGIKVFSIGLNIGNINAENDLNDMASTTGGKYYNSSSAENLDKIFNSIYKSVITHNLPKNIDLIVTLPKNLASIDHFSIRPTTKILDGENLQIEWQNIAQYVGNKDAILDGDEIFTGAYIIGKLPNTNNQINGKILLNYNDTISGENKVEFTHIS